VILDGRAVQSTPGSGAGAGYDGQNRRNGRPVHLAVDTLGHLLATVITPANEQERTQVTELAARVQDVTGQTVELAWVDEGYTSDAAGPKRGFVLLPPPVGGRAEFRLVRDYERLPKPWWG